MARSQEVVAVGFWQNYFGHVCSQQLKVGKTLFPLCAGPPNEKSERAIVLVTEALLLISP